LKEIEAKVVQENFLWFEAFHSDHPELINRNCDSDNPTVLFISSFDYEKRSSDKWRVYIDIGIKLMPIAKIMVRLAFEFKRTGILWDDVFDIEVIRNMVDLTMKQCIITFKENCKESAIELPFEIPFSEEVVLQISNSIISQYFDIRKPQDIANSYLLSKIGLECKPETDAVILLKCTFMVLDELFYNSKLFNRKHNLEVFSDYMPEPKYFTIKMNCCEIDEHQVKLNYFDTILFYICVDCALQMLVGDKSDLLIAALERSGFTDGIKKAFLKHGTAFFEQYQTKVVMPGVRIINLEEKHDWNMLFR
jgi:hypothetical protein